MKSIFGMLLLLPTLMTMCIYGNGKRDKRGDLNERWQCVSRKHVGVETSEKMRLPGGRREDGKEWEPVNKEKM
jgi:hypothetical protein